MILFIQVGFPYHTIYVRVRQLHHYFRRFEVRINEINFPFDEQEFPDSDPNLCLYWVHANIPNIFPAVSQMSEKRHFCIKNMFRNSCVGTGTICSAALSAGEMLSGVLCSILGHCSKRVKMIVFILVFILSVLVHLMILGTFGPMVFLILVSYLS